MKDFFHSTVKKVTLDLVYDAVDQRTKDIREDITKLNGKVQHLENEMNRRFETMQSEMNRRFEAMDQKFAAMDQKFTAMDQKFTALNTRFDQLFSLILSQHTQPEK